MIENINLPKPFATSIEYIRGILLYTNYPENYYQSKQYHDKNNPTLTCAGCFYQHELKLTSLIKNQFKQLFEEDLIVQLIRFRNFSSTTTAVFPPHTDKGKLLNLNYVIDTGGDDVRTIFYNKEDDSPDKLLGQSEQFENLLPIKSYVTKPEEWYAVDVKRFHSIANIVGTRTLLCLGFNSISFTDFKLKYNNLIIGADGEI